MKASTLSLAAIAVIALFVAGWFAGKGCNRPPAVIGTVRVDTVRVAPDTILSTATVIRKIPVYVEISGTAADSPPCPDFIASIDTTIQRTATVAGPEGIVDVAFDQRVQTSYDSRSSLQTVILDNPPILWLDSLPVAVQQALADCDGGHGFWADLGIWAVGVVVGAIGILALIWGGAK